MDDPQEKVMDQPTGFSPIRVAHWVSPAVPILLLVLTGLLQGASGWAQAAIHIGQSTPPMVATGLDGQTYDLQALRGKVVLVNFWATWCVPCQKEMPLLDEFYRRHRDQGLALIGISVDRARDREKVRKMMRAYGYPAAMLTDVHANGFDPPDGVPMTYVLDTNGVVRDGFIAIDEALLAHVVTPLLPQATSPAAASK
jgi:cytochrome c biogenesis protein CcmG, thiol:disulfide interchange protein DsbE